MIFFAFWKYDLVEMIMFGLLMNEVFYVTAAIYVIVVVFKRLFGSGMLLMVNSL